MRKYEQDAHMTKDLYPEYKGLKQFNWEIRKKTVHKWNYTNGQ